MKQHSEYILEQLKGEKNFSVGWKRWKWVIMTSSWRSRPTTVL